MYLLPVVLDFSLHGVAQVLYILYSKHNIDIKKIQLHGVGKHPPPQPVGSKNNARELRKARLSTSRARGRT
jgi:hypothetical protein